MSCCSIDGVVFEFGCLNELFEAFLNLESYLYELPDELDDKD